MPLPLLLLGAGTTLQVLGSISAGNSQKHAAEEEAARREIEAREIMERLRVNRLEVLREADVFKGKQSLSIAASGRLTNDSTLSMLEDTNAGAVRKIASLEEEATFNANTLLAEGRLAQQKGNDLQQAGLYSSIGTLLTSGYSAYSSFTKTPRPNPDMSPYSLSTWDLGKNTTDIGKFR